MPGDELVDVNVLIKKKPQQNGLVDVNSIIRKKKEEADSVGSLNGSSTQSKPLESPTTPTTNLSPSGLLLSNSADEGKFLGGGALPEKVDVTKVKGVALPPKNNSQGEINIQNLPIGGDLSENVKQSVALANKGNELFSKGDDVMATETFKQSVDQYPQNIVAVRGLGDIAEKNGDYDAAIKQYSDALHISNSPEDLVKVAQQQVNIANKLMQSKKPVLGLTTQDFDSDEYRKHALENINVAIQANPNDYKAWELKAAIEQANGNKEGVNDALEKAKIVRDAPKVGVLKVDENGQVQWKTLDEITQENHARLVEKLGETGASVVDIPMMMESAKAGIEEGSKDMLEGAMKFMPGNATPKSSLTGLLQFVGGGAKAGMSVMLAGKPVAGYTFINGLALGDEISGGTASKVLFGVLENYTPKTNSEVVERSKFLFDQLVGLALFHVVSQGKPGETAKIKEAANAIRNGGSVKVGQVKDLADNLNATLSDPNTLQQYQEILTKIPEDASAKTISETAPKLKEKADLETERQTLETEKAKVDESFHPAIDEKIKTVDNSIEAIKQDIAETIKSEGLKLREKVGLPLGEPAIEQPFQKPESRIFSNVPEPTKEPTRVEKLKQESQSNSGVTVEKPTTTLSPEELNNPPKTEAINEEVATSANLPSSKVTENTPKETPPIELTNEGGGSVDVGNASNEKDFFKKIDDVLHSKYKQRRGSGSGFLRNVIKYDLPENDIPVTRENIKTAIDSTINDVRKNPTNYDNGYISELEQLKRAVDDIYDVYESAKPAISTEQPITQTPEEGKGVDLEERAKNADGVREMLDESSTDKDADPLTFSQKDKIETAINEYEKGNIDGVELRKALVKNGLEEKYLGKKLLEKGLISDVVEPPKQIAAPKPEKTFTATGKKLADKIRKAKSKPLELKDENGNPITIEQKGIDLNPIIDAIADGVEKGGEIADVIKEQLEKAKWFQNLTDKGKETVTKQLGEHFDENYSGISHALTEETRQEFGLGEPYEGRTRKTDAELNVEAENAIKKGYNIEGLISELENGTHPNDVETAILKKYKAGLEATIEKDPSDANLTELKRLVKATDKIGSEQGAAFRQRQGLDVRDDSLAGFFTRDSEVNEGAPLTETQKARVLNEYNAIKEAQKKYDDKIASLEAQLAKAKAEKNVTKEKAATKKVKRTHEDFVEERKKIAESIREKLRKSRGQANEVFNATVEFAKIAPDVAKLVKSYVEEGVSKLEDIIKEIHPILKENIPEITEKDIHDIIAGEHNPPKKTRNEITQKVYELRQQAKLANQLDALQNGIEPKNEKAKVKRNQEIEKLRNQIDEHDLTKISQYKNRVRTEIEKLNEELKPTTLTKPEPKPKIKLDKEGQKLQDELIKLKQDREVRLLRQEYENRTDRQKLGDRALELLNVPRTVMSSTDFSAPLRQAVVATIAHPSIAAKAGLEMFKQAVSQKRFDRWFHDLKNDPRYKLMEDAGLYVADPHDPRLSAKEEAFMNNLAEKIPVIGKLIKGSERAYVGYLNKMRVDLFNRGAEILEDRGQTFENSSKEYKDLASWVNNATGRGKLGTKGELAAPLLNSAIFAPRLIAARLNLLNPIYYAKLSPAIRKMAIGDMAKFIGFGLTVLAVSKLSGADVEPDPRSTDFGKIKVGNTRWDIWGGFQPYVRIIAQMLAGESKSTRSGQIQELSGQGAFGRTRGDVLASFARGKLAPVPSMLWDFASGKTVTGDKVTIGSEFASHMVPLTISDIITASKDQGVKAIFTTGIPSTFGVSVQTYAPRGYDRAKLKDPTYKFLYDKQMNITTPNQGEMKDKEYDEFLNKRENIFKKEWQSIINHGAYLDEDGTPTISHTTKTKPSSELSLEDLSDLMKSIGSKATREAKKKPKTDSDTETEAVEQPELITN